MKAKAFTLVDTICVGASSTIYRGRRQDGQLCAIKVVESTDCAELRILQRLPKHANVASLLDCEVEGSKVYIVLEYYPTDLLRMLQQVNKLNLLQTRNLAWMLLQGLHHIHSHGVMHRDLKPENILLEPLSDDLELCRLAVSDFGNSKVIERGPHTGYISTRWYRAPEQLVGLQNYNTKVDIFAAGCIIAEMLTSQPLFPGQSELDQLTKLAAVLGAPPAKSAIMDKLSKLGLQVTVCTTTQIKERLRAITGATELCVDLLVKMLTWDQDDRLTAAQCLVHGFFA